VLLSVCPGATVVDIAHDLPAHDVRAAALVVLGACRLFPPGTIHVVVIDPGVGSQRRLLACRIDEHVYLAPDNGVLGPVIAGGRLSECRAIENAALFRPEVSRTFHGRDILAPVAGALACGTPLSQVGPECRPSVVRDWPQPQRDGRRILGEVIAVDRFGNLITNVPASWLPTSPSATVRMGPIVVRGPVSAYADAAVGDALAIVGSYDLLELAVNRGSLARATDAGPGTGVEVELPAM
jgi:hypothetical protein